MVFAQNFLLSPKQACTSRIYCAANDALLSLPCRTKRQQMLLQFIDILNTQDW